MDTHVVNGTSIPDLIRGIVNDVRMLVREELALARVELREQANRARAAAISFGIAAVTLALAGVFLLVALAMGISALLLWPVWAGFLTVAVLLGIAGGVAFMMGRSQVRQVHPVPEETVTTLKENSAWIAKRLSSAPR